jgi:hypothetical protein
MKQTKLGQKGFAAVETLLILVVIAIIGGTGYYVYHSYNKSNDNLNTAQTNANSATPPKKKDSTKYLTITEWNIRAPITGTMELQYTLMNNDTQADFTSKQLLDKDAACTAGFGGTISRYAPDENASADGTGNETAKERAAKADKSTYAYVGGNYYFFDHSQAGCGDDVAKTKDAQQQTNDAVKALISKLQAVPKS